MGVRRGEGPQEEGERNARVAVSIRSRFGMPDRVQIRFDSYSDPGLDSIGLGEDRVRTRYRVSYGGHRYPLLTSVDVEVAVDRLCRRRSTSRRHRCRRRPAEDMTSTGFHRHAMS
eukprot:4905881-Pyramimonas_sp.AAC.1